MSITIQALGRPCHIGQLYDARASTLLSGFQLFDVDVENRKDTHSRKSEQDFEAHSTFVDFRQVRTVKDRAKSLDISASLTISILAGAFDISGMGNFLDNTNESVESTTIVAVGRYRTFCKSLDINKVRQFPLMNSSEIVATGATHVVTSIVYGGNIVASFTQNVDRTSSDSDVRGNFNADVLKSFCGIVGVEASGDLKVAHKDRLSSLNLDVKLTADFFSKEQQLPSTAPELLSLFKRSPRLVGDGIPCDITLIPLSWLQTKTPTFRDLADGDILELTNLYDGIVLLGQNRSALSRDVQNHKDLFPSFYSLCQKSVLRVGRLVQQAREELRFFLLKVRSGLENTRTPSVFRREVETRFKQEEEQFRRDRETWLGIADLIRAARVNHFPITTIDYLRTVMAEQLSGAIAVVLIPENLHFPKLLANYRELAGEIRRWRATVENIPASRRNTGGNPVGGTLYLSVYADPIFDGKLTTLDDSTKSITVALSTARGKSEPAFLIYGLSTSTDFLSRLQWNLLNEEGWGVLVNTDEDWRYVGDVHRGVRHGQGMITYADGSVYIGSWFGGKRDGAGEYFPPSHLSSKKLANGTKCIYVDDKLASDGVIIMVTVYRVGSESPVRFRRVALRSEDATITQVDKIGRVLGWRLGDRYRLELSSPSGKRISIIANGTRVDPSMSPETEMKPWPLEKNTENVVLAFILNDR